MKVVSAWWELAHKAKPADGKSDAPVMPRKRSPSVAKWVDFEPQNESVGGKGKKQKTRKKGRGVIAGKTDKRLYFLQWRVKLPSYAEVSQEGSQGEVLSPYSTGQHLIPSWFYSHRSAVA